MKKMKQLKLLILAGAEVHAKIVREAKKLGIYTIVTDYLPLAKSPAKQIADEAWDIDIFDTAAIVEKARAAGVNGVLNYCIDPAQLPYYEICKALKLPCYGTKEQFAIMTDKQKFKEFARHNGIDVVPEYSLAELQENPALFPVIIKPISSRGSRGQKIINSYAELKAALSLVNSEVIIEKYIANGWDFSFAGLASGGKVHIVKTGDRYLGLKKDHLERQQIATVIPSLFTDWYRENIVHKVENFARALGLNFAPLFLQGIISGGRLYFYDPGLRFPGTDYDLALQRATGCDPMRSFINFALTGEQKLYGDYQRSYNYGGKLCLIYSIAARKGEIAVIKGLDKIAADHRILAIDQRYDAGELVPASGDIRQRILEFTVLVDDMAAAKDLTEFVNNNLVVLDEQGQDMLVSRLGREVLLIEDREKCLKKFTSK